MKTLKLTFAVSLAATLLVSHTRAATLTWDAPTHYEDGTAISNALTYVVLTGSQSGDYDRTNTTTGLTQDLPSPKNTWQYSVVYAVDGMATSEPSDELKWADTVKPNPPSRLRKLIDMVIGWFRRRKGLRVA